MSDAAEGPYQVAPLEYELEPPPAPMIDTRPPDSASNRLVGDRTGCDPYNDDAEAWFGASSPGRGSSPRFGDEGDNSRIMWSRKEIPVVSDLVPKPDGGPEEFAALYP